MIRALRFAPVVCVLLIAVFYWPSSNSQYVWDDISLFLDTDALRNPHSIWKAISDPILPGTSYFRPLVLLSFIGEFYFFGTNPWVSHVINILIHILNSLLVYLLAVRILGGTRAVVAMFFYGLHPAMVEPVAWASGRFDLLVTMFVLLGLFAFVSLCGWMRTAVVCTMFLGAALCKEMAATFPVLIFMFGLLSGDVRIVAGKVLPVVSKRFWVFFACLIGTGFLYLGIRSLGPASLVHIDEYVAGKLDLLDHMAFVGLTIKFYATLVLVPFADLSPMHPFNPSNMSAGMVVVGLLVLAFFLLVPFLLFFTREKFLVLTVTGLFSLFPVLNVLPLTVGGNIGHERFLAVPLVFFSMAVAAIHIPERLLSVEMKRLFPRISGALFVFWCLVAVANINVTVPLWKDNISLWGWAYTKNPDFDFVRASYLAAAIRDNRFDIAQKIVEDLDRKNVTNKQILSIKGRYLGRVGKLDEAEKTLKYSIEGVPEPHMAFVQKGIDISDVKISSKTVNNLWFFRSVHGALSEVYLAKKDFDKAIEEADISLFYQHDYPPSFLVKALAYYGKGEKKAADELFERAISLYDRSAHADAYAVRAHFLHQLCMFADAPESVCSNAGSVNLGKIGLYDQAGQERLGLQ